MKPTKGTCFQNKLVLSSSLASVQHLVIPWMLIHLTGTYHKLVDDPLVIIYCAVLVVMLLQYVC